ncbi:11039_t:CDS:2, partial [Entrophospora sp. SA101]
MFWPYPVFHWPVKPEGIRSASGVVDVIVVSKILPTFTNFLYIPYMFEALIMVYVGFLRTNLLEDFFTAVKFFKYFQFTFSQKKHAEEALFKALKTVASENGVLAKKAKSFLAVLDKHIHSAPVQQFWYSVYLQNEKNKSHTAQALLQEQEIQETCHIKSNVLKEHIIESDQSSSSDSEIVPISLINVFHEISDKSEKNLDKTAELETSSALTKEVNDKKQKTKNQYITRDLVKEVLDAYQMCILAGEKLIHNGINVLDFTHSTNEIKKGPLSIGIINIHNADCTKYLPDDFKKYIANQLQDPEIKAIKFSNGRTINKLHVDCEEEVLQFLDKFDHVMNLESLGKHLVKNSISYFSVSNDLIYVQNLFHHFYFLYKNDILLQPMSEYEFNAYIWTSLLRNAFLEKMDMKLSYGELASRSYNKLKEILNVAGNSGPKLDGKGFLKSLGTEVLAQEDGVLNTHGKRTSDLKKLEYCTKIILTVLYFALPTTVEPRYNGHIGLASMVRYNEVSGNQ